MDRKQAINYLVNHPARFGRLIGFTKLTELHNGWIKWMAFGEGDATLQAHRNSYKTTCVSIALALLVVLFPKKRILFVRKTDADVKEIIAQVRKILQTQEMIYFCECIYGVTLRLMTDNAMQISTNLSVDIKGTAQLTGTGSKGSITGQHYDLIFTDDIVNLDDRFSRAERERVIVYYQELQNIKNRGGRIFNTGTPWHKNDAFSVMPPATRYDVYSTGLLTDAEIAEKKASMTASLYAANYELRHIASDDIIFTDPVTGADPAKVEQGEAHIDAAYGGEDYTAFTICRREGEKYYVYGRLWRKHVDDVQDKIIELRKQFCAGRIFCEDNGDKGYLAKALRKKGERVSVYHESMNKFLKITSYLKGEWKNVIFVAGTDDDYINQICDYNEEAEHDDAPDSLASIVRRLWKRGDSAQSNFQALPGWGP